MSVRLVIGKAGSGKTHRCFRAIVEACRADPLGPPIYWIVPKQATFQTERALTCAPELGGFCRARVVSFESLGEDLLEECGGAAIPEVTPLGRQMILGHLLRKHQPSLRYFSHSARQPGLASRLDATFADFERNGRTAVDMSALLSDLERIRGVDAASEPLSPSADSLFADPEPTPDPSSTVPPALRALHNKFHDLHLLYAAYTAYLGQERLDRHRRLDQVVDCMATSPSLRGAAIYIDDFGRFTDYELNLIAGLAKACSSVEVMLMIDPASPLLANPHLNPEDLSPFHSVEETYRRLWAALTRENVPIEGPIILREIHRFRAPALSLIEKDITRRLAIHRDTEPDGIEMIQAENRRAEVDAVARRIRALITTKGYRLREIAVILRDLDSYHELIQASFHEHDIAFFVDRRRAVVHHPLLAFVRGALQIVQTGWPHDAVMSLLKSGLTGTPDSDIDELENYVLSHRIRGSSTWTQTAPWAFARKMLGAEDEDPRQTAHASRIDAIRQPIVEKLAKFTKAITAKKLSLRQIVLAVFDCLDHFKVQSTVARWMDEAHAASQFEQRDEHAQAWKTFVDLFDQMAELLGDEPATLADFIEIYEAGLESFELAITPPTLDQVLVGQIDRTRAPDVRAVIVMGLNEGVFPKMPREDTVLSDAERRELRNRHIDVDPDTHRKLLDENLLGYLAFTRASERLILTRSQSDAGGKPLGPSRFWDRFIELFPKLKPRLQTIGGENQSPLQCIGTPRQLITSLMTWVRSRATRATSTDASTERSPAARPESPTFPALYHWLATHPTADDSIDIMRYRAWKALQYANAATLSKDVVRQLFGTTLNASVTRIETFAACPFKHFARYGLDLRPRDEEDEVSPLDLGNVFHHVLEKIVAALVEQKQGWPDLPADQRTALIHELSQEVGKELRGEILLSSARNRYMLRRIETTLEQVAASQEAAARRCSFSPAYAELTFGNSPDADLPPLELQTARHHRLLLSGKIDRVDLTPDGASFAVIDYKLSGSSLALDRVFHGLSLQLLTYLLVLRENGQKLTGQRLTPAAAFYVKLLRDLEDVQHPTELDSDDPSLLHLREPSRGILRAESLHQLDHTLQAGGRSAIIAANIKADGSLGSRSRSDLADDAEFTALIDHVSHRLAYFTDQILEGNIALHPYLMRRTSPCPYCDFRPFCRFDQSLNRYHSLPTIPREEVLKRLAERKSVASDIVA